MSLPLWAIILVLAYSAIVVGLAIRFVYYARNMFVGPPQTPADILRDLKEKIKNDD